MPWVIVTEIAVAGLRRSLRFLSQRNARAAGRAALVIQRQFDLLETLPGTGRKVDQPPDMRELIIPFGDSGYVALYRHEPGRDEIYVLAFRHQREAGY